MTRTVIQMPSTSSAASAAEFMSGFAYSETEFRRIGELLGRLAGIHLADSKKQMAFNRLVGLVRRNTYPNFGAFLDEVERGRRDVVEAFVNALTTNVTAFNRERHHLRMLVDHLRALPPADIRVWSAGCSGGQEAWSILFTLDETFGTATLLRRRPAVMGSDIDTEMLAIARRGVYRDRQVAELDPAQRSQYFEPCGAPGTRNAELRVRQPWRDSIEFRRINLCSESSLTDEGDTRFDAIFCRNVMIYFSVGSQRRVIERFHRRLKPGGLLFVGHSESLGTGDDLFAPLGQTCFARKE